MAQEVVQLRQHRLRKVDFFMLGHRSQSDAATRRANSMNSYPKAICVASTTTLLPAPATRAGLRLASPVRILYLSQLMLQKRATDWRAGVHSARCSALAARARRRLCE